MKPRKKPPKITHVRIDQETFKKMFEPKRLEYSRKYKVNLSQRTFLRMILTEKTKRRKNVKTKQKR